MGAAEQAAARRGPDRAVREPRVRSFLVVPLTSRLHVEGLPGNQDPGELRNLCAERPALAEEYRRKLASFVERHAGQGLARGPQPADPDVVPGAGKVSARASGAAGQHHGARSPDYDDFPNTGGAYANPAVLPPPPPPTDFYTVMPCRLADTRKAAGPLGGPALVAGAIRSFPVTGVCGITSGAIAVSFNVTAVVPAAQGHLTVYAGDAAGTPPTIRVKNGSAGAVDLVLDVNVYYQ